jgi:hypothetical protein
MLTKYQAIDPNCKKVYCSTCGGFAFSVSKKMPKTQKLEIISFIKNLNFDELTIDFEWIELFKTFENKYSITDSYT